MAPTRRQALHLVGTTAVASLAGCLQTGFGSSSTDRTYTLTVESLSVSPVDHALYSPGDDTLFGDPTRTALENILPDGRHTTYGYEPLPENVYVEHAGTYYQTKHVVTGRQEMDRDLVRVEPVPRDAVPDDATLVGDLDRPSARVIKILHAHAQTDGEGSSSELLRDDAYVLRRPAERESQLATGELADTVVTMDEQGAWAYRVQVTREQIPEVAHTFFAATVADSREQFREIVFASRIDAELVPDDLSSDSREKLQQAIARDRYRETAPLSDAFKELLDALGVGDVDTAVNGQLLWYDEGYYRYALYVNDSS